MIRVRERAPEPVFDPLDVSTEPSEDVRSDPRDKLFGPTEPVEPGVSPRMTENVEPNPIVGEGDVIYVP